MIPRNDPARAGQLASAARTPCGQRLVIFPVHTRVDRLCWFIQDAINEEILGQHKTVADALQHARRLAKIAERKENA